MKLLPCFCAYSLSLGIAYAQGTVWFDNFTWNVDAPFFNEQGNLLEGPDYAAQLYYWIPGEGFRSAGGPVSFGQGGYFDGDADGLPLRPVCGSAWVQVRAWETQAGGTFEEAALARAWTGVSNTLFIERLGNPHSPTSCQPPNMVGLQYPGLPLIVRQPQSQAVLSSEPAKLAVIASSGVQTSYQWHQQPSNRPDGLIEGATNATYTTPSLETNTTFWVNIENLAGLVSSEKVTVTVVPAPPELSLEQSTGRRILSLEGTVGITYRIEYSPDLSGTNWTSLVEVLLQSSPFTWTDSDITDSPARFYRARVVP